jgi:hypothetical protein
MTTNFLSFFFHTSSFFVFRFYYSVVRFVCLFICFFFHCVTVVALILFCCIYTAQAMCFGLARQHNYCVCVFSNLSLSSIQRFCFAQKTKKFLCTALSSIITCNCFVYIIYNCVCLCAYFIYCKGFVVTHFLLDRKDDNTRRWR